MVFIPTTSEMAYDYTNNHIEDYLNYLYDRYGIDNFSKFRLLEVIESLDIKDSIIVLISYDGNIKLKIQNSKIYEYLIYSDDSHSDVRCINYPTPLSAKQKRIVDAMFAKIYEKNKSTKEIKFITNEEQEIIDICRNLCDKDFNTIYYTLSSYIFQKIMNHKKIIKFPSDKVFFSYEPIMRCLRDNQYEKYPQFKKYADMIFFG